MFSQYNQYEDAGPVDPDLFPATVTVADHLPVQLEDEFAFGLELIIDGLAQQAKQLARAAARHPWPIQNLRAKVPFYAFPLMFCPMRSTHAG